MIWAFTVLRDSKMDRCIQNWMVLIRLLLAPTIEGQTLRPHVTQSIHEHLTYLNRIKSSCAFKLSAECCLISITPKRSNDVKTIKAINSQFIQSSVIWFYHCTTCRFFFYFFHKTSLRISCCRGIRWCQFVHLPLATRIYRYRFGINIFTIR